MSMGSRRFKGAERRGILINLLELHSDGKVYFWGEKGDFLYGS